MENDRDAMEVRFSLVFFFVIEGFIYCNRNEYM